MQIDPEGFELAALRQLGAGAGQRVIEIGAGDGRLTWLLASEAAQWLALDPDHAELVTAATTCKAEPPPRHVGLLRADGRALPFAAACCDLALFAWSLC